MTLEEKIERLSFDPIFGILTRPAIELFIEENYEDCNKSFTCVFIDIKDLHMMNRDFGYEETNKKIREAFYIIKEYVPWIDTIGRWFSGDEMIIIFNHVVTDAVIERKYIPNMIGFFELFGIKIRYDILKNIKSIKDLESKIKYLHN